MLTPTDNTRALAALIRPHSFALLALLLLAGSSCSSTGSKPAPSYVPERENAPIDQDRTAGLTGTVVGHVTLDGRPVSNFGVTVHVNHRSLALPAPISVHASDGRFLVRVPHGEWDLVFAGPGFARHVVKKLNVRAGEANVPLQVRVDRGDTVQGRVTNAVGDAVHGAVVRISQNPSTLTKELLWELARGNFSTVTSATGMFRFDDVSSVADRASIAASLPGIGVSHPQSLSNGDTTINFVLYPVGSIVGALTTTSPISLHFQPIYVAVAHLVNGPVSTFSAVVAKDGTFQIGDVPEGEYDIGLVSPNGVRTGTTTTKRILVTAGKPVRVLLPIVP